MLQESRLPGPEFVRSSLGVQPLGCFLATRSKLKLELQTRNSKLGVHSSLIASSSLTKHDAW
jgi:hypothetical protein